MYISHGARNITALGLKKSSAKLLPTNTVCLTTRAPIGYVAIAQNALSTNQGFKNFLPSEKYLSKYLYWYLKGNVELLESHASGTTFLELSKRRLEQIPIPLPPLDEQLRIVDLLDELFTDLDKVKALAQGVVDGSELRRAAILYKALTGDLTKLWRDEHGITLDSWQKNFLSDVLIFSKQKTNDFSASGLKYGGLENMEKNGGRISFQAANDVRSTKNIFHAGDLLYGKLRPYLDKHGVWQALMRYVRRILSFSKRASRLQSNSSIIFSAFRISLNMPLRIPKVSIFRVCRKKLYCVQKFFCRRLTNKKKSSASSTTCLVRNGGR